MRIGSSPFWLTTSLAALLTTGLSADVLFEDFSRMPMDGCYVDGRIIGAWQFVYDGYGCNTSVSVNLNRMLVARPKAPTQPDETHAALILGPTVVGDFLLEVSTATAQQLRTGSPANPWEAAWVLWHYTGDSQFYYFVAKPNGWELGKEDPSYPGGQRFLATGSSPSFPIGRWYRIAVTQSEANIRVAVNGAVIVSAKDSERPYNAGRIGLYTEDAEAYFDDVAIRTKKSRLPVNGK